MSPHRRRKRLCTRRVAAEDQNEKLAEVSMVFVKRVSHAKVRDVILAFVLVPRGHQKAVGFQSRLVDGVMPPFALDPSAHGVTTVVGDQRPRKRDTLTVTRSARVIPEQAHVRAIPRAGPEVRRSIKALQPVLFAFMAQDQFHGRSGPAAA